MPMFAAALSGPWPRIGVIVAALLAAATILSRRADRRAWAMLGALILCPVLLLDDVWHSSQLDIVHRHPAEAVVAAIVALAVLAGAAYLISRRPALVAPLAVLALPFRVPIHAGGSTSNLLVPLYFVIGASALAWIAPTLWAAHRGGSSSGRAERAAPHLFEKLLAAYVVVYAIQALYSPDFEKAVQNVVFFYVPFAVLLSLLRDMEWNRQMVVRCLTITAGLAVIFACVGFIEEATKSLLLNSKLAHNNQQHRYFTVNSVFYDPDIFGRYLALAMVLVTSILLYDRRPRFQAGSCAILAILWAGMIFTLSRSSLAALMVGLAVLAAYRWRAAPIIGLGVAVVLVGVVALIVSPSTFGLNQGLNGASSGRANLVSGGLHMFAQRPIQGHGSGSFHVVYSREYPGPARSVSQSHDIPVTIASEQGIIGLALYIAFVVTALIVLFRGARGHPARVAIAAAFLALLFHTLLYADFLEDPATWALLGAGAALATASRGVNPETSAVHQESSRQLHPA